MPYEYNKIFDNIAASNYSITTTDKIIISDKLSPASNCITVSTPISSITMPDCYTEYISKIDESKNCEKPKDKESKDKPKDKESNDISKDYTPKRIIRNGPMTIVFWEDGTKTLVRLKEGMVDDPYMAFCSALAKKIFGNNSRVKKVVAKTKLELPKEMRK